MKNNGVIAVLAFYNVVVSVAGFYVVMSLLGPASACQTSNSTSVVPVQASLFLVTFKLSCDAALFAIVVTMGALGSIAFALSYMGWFVGKEKFEKSYWLWYLVHPLIGSSLALIFYFAIRGGFLNPSVSNTSINVYGVGALSALVGFSSRAASEKLGDLFKTLFGVKDSGGQQTSAQLSVSLVSPQNGETVTSSPVKLNVKVANSVQGATVTIYLDGNQVCSGSTDSTGSYSCQPAVTKTGGAHSWNATASKTGFTDGTSPKWTFTY